MIKHRFLLACFLFCSGYLSAQNDTSPLTGVYSDGFAGGFQTTRLELKPDKTFRLLTPDPVFSYTFKTYETTGRWTGNGRQIILNPEPVDVERTPRSKKVVFKKGKAYFYEIHGEVNTSWVAAGLTKQKN